MKNPNREEDKSDENFVCVDLGKQISPLLITFIPGEQFFYTTLIVGAHETVSSMVNSAQACVISPNFSRRGLRPRRLSIKRYHARFRAIMVK